MRTPRVLKGAGECASAHANNDGGPGYQKWSRNRGGSAVHEGDVWPARRAADSAAAATRASTTCEPVNPGSAKSGEHLRVLTSQSQWAVRRTIWSSGASRSHAARSNVVGTRPG